MDGKDTPPIARPSNVKKEKADRLIKWVVNNCQLRPGRMRNVRFTKEGTYPKDLPVHMRHGSFDGLFEVHSDSVPKDLLVGRTAFRPMLRVVTAKEVTTRVFLIVTPTL